MFCKSITALEQNLEYEPSREKRAKLSHQNDSTTESKPGHCSSKFENLCLDVFIEIFRYLHPIDLIYSLDNLIPHLNGLIEQHTRSIDFRLIKKSFFNKFIETLPIHSIGHIEKMYLSNNFTCGQISEMFEKFPWSRLTRLQSLKLDLIGSFELSKYLNLIHSFLRHLYSLSVAFDTSDSVPDSSLLPKILRLDNRQIDMRLTECFITGFPCTFSSNIDSSSNEILRTLKITLKTVDDLFVIYRLFPKLENLSCDISDDTSKSIVDFIVSSTCLTDLTLIIDKSITLKLLEKILSPHQQLRSLIFKALLVDETLSKDLAIEVNGLELEKIFRRFSNLINLKFYLRYIQNPTMWDRHYKPNHFYLYPFTCRFWSDRSIHIITHTLNENRERYIYTIPFAFDTFELDGHVTSILNENLTFAYNNVQHLIISSATAFDQYIYSTVIIKNFPNLKKLTLMQRLSSIIPIDFLSNHRWICETKPSVYPLIYTRLEDPSMHKLTIYEMSDSKWNELRQYFPTVRILVLHIQNLSTFLLTRNVYIDLIFQMESLFSLTVHHPEGNLTNSMRSVLLEKLSSSKKYFFIKCDRGILKLWF